ncbi:MAG: hypothetical protein AAB334_01135 [Patescibacteria group bacterium]
MTELQNFSENLEQNLARLGEHIERKIESSSGEQNINEREIVRESIRSFANEVKKSEKEVVISNIQPQQQNTNSTSPASLVLPTYLQREEKNEEIKRTFATYIWKTAKYC